MKPLRKVIASTEINSFKKGRYRVELVKLEGLGYHLNVERNGNLVYNQKLSSGILTISGEPQITIEDLAEILSIVIGYTKLFTSYGSCARD